MDSRHYDNKRLTELRKEMGLTQQQLAEKLNVDRQTVYRAENGVTTSYEFLVDVAAFFGIAMTEVIYPYPGSETVSG